MDQRQLNSLLRQLDSELRAADRIDSGNRELIERLADDIRPILEGKAPAAQYDGLRDRLADAATAFEAEHPKLGTVIENVIDALVRLNL